MVTHPPHTHALAGRHQLIGEHAGIARVGALPGIFPDGFELHVLLFPAHKVEPARVLPMVPLLEVDPRDPRHRAPCHPWPHPGVVGSGPAA